MRTVTGVIYAFSDRKNGWYCFAHDAEGNQIGDAEYRYRKADVIAVAKAIAHEAGDVPVKRG